MPDQNDGRPSQNQDPSDQPIDQGSVPAQPESAKPEPAQPEPEELAITPQEQDPQDLAHQELNERRLEALDRAVAGILSGPEKDEERQSVLLQESLIDKGLNKYSLQECRGFIRSAQQGAIKPIYGWHRSENKTHAIHGGDPLWGNLLQAGGFNLVTAAPKVGKSALMLHLAACVFRGDLQCLGVDILDRFEHLIIVGTDMSTAGWGRILQREGLAEIAEDHRSFTWIDHRITLMDSESDLALNAAGISWIREECRRHSNSLLLIDTLRSVTTTLGIDEYKPEIVRPLYALRKAIADLNVTTVVNHHENKSGTGMNAVAGSGALVGAVDVVLSMQWLNPVEVGLQQVDDRRLLSSSGRLAGDSLVVELKDDDETGHWVTWGKGDEFKANQAREKAIGELQGRDLRVMEVAWDLWDVDQYLTLPIVQDRCSLKKKLAENVINKLIKRGLLKKDGVCNSEFQGRPSNRYRPFDEEELPTTLPDDYLAKRASGSQKGVLHHLSHLHQEYRDEESTGAKENQGLAPFAPFAPESTICTDAPVQGDQKPPLGTVVMYKDQPCILVSHEIKDQYDLKLKKAAKIKDQWISTGETSYRGRWQFDTFSATPEQLEPAPIISDEPETETTWWGQ